MHSCSQNLTSPDGFVLWNPEKGLSKVIKKQKSGKFSTIYENTLFFFFFTVRRDLIYSRQIRGKTESQGNSKLVFLLSPWKGLKKKKKKRISREWMDENIRYPYCWRNITPVPWTGWCVWGWYHRGKHNHKCQTKFSGKTVLLQNYLLSLRLKIFKHEIQKLRTYLFSLTLLEKASRFWYPLTGFTHIASLEKRKRKACVRFEKYRTYD